MNSYYLYESILELISDNIIIELISDNIISIFIICLITYIINLRTKLNDKDKEINNINKQLLESEQENECYNYKEEKPSNKSEVIAIENLNKIRDLNEKLEIEILSKDKEVIKLLNLLSILYKNKGIEEIKKLEKEIKKISEEKEKIIYDRNECYDFFIYIINSLKYNKKFNDKDKEINKEVKDTIKYYFIDSDKTGELQEKFFGNEKNKKFFRNLLKKLDLI